MVSGVVILFTRKTTAAKSSPTDNLQIKNISNEGQSNSPDTSNIKTTDLNPDLPNNQKTAVVIMNSDSSMEKVIISNSMVSDYLRGLGPDVKVISKTPLQ